ncbi:MAG: hypothetical protein JSS02_33635 [Planctomycetes bacterium]|nr:hypothetical protein [Planctomycetota bacterium]
MAALREPLIEQFLGAASYGGHCEEELRAEANGSFDRHDRGQQMGLTQSRKGAKEFVESRYRNGMVGIESESQLPVRNPNRRDRY